MNNMRDELTELGNLISAIVDTPFDNSPLVVALPSQWQRLRELSESVYCRTTGILGTVSNGSNSRYLTDTEVEHG